MWFSPGALTHLGMDSSRPLKGRCRIWNQDPFCPVSSEVWVTRTEDNPQVRLAAGLLDPVVTDERGRASSVTFDVIRMKRQSGLLSPPVSGHVRGTVLSTSSCLEGHTSFCASVARQGEMHCGIEWVEQVNINNNCLS